jgi:uncharacterized protein DUF4238
MENKKSRQARKHHILPQFYLRSFVDSSKIVWCHDFYNKNSYQTTVPNAACIEDFYTVETINQQEDDCIEQNLIAPIEARASSIIKRMVENICIPTSEEWEILSNFVALMYLRGPWFRQIIIETHEHLGKKILADMISSEDKFNEVMRKFRQSVEQEEDLTFEKALEVYNNCEISSNIPRNFYIKLMLEHAAGLVNFFFRMTPNLVSVSPATRSRFITSDFPFAPFYKSQAGNRSIHKGLLDPNIDLYFPLSPWRCLLINYNNFPRRERIIERKVAYINDIIASNCTRLILSQAQNFAWKRDDNSISWSTEEAIDLYADSKIATPRMRIAGQELLAECRNDWNLLRGKEPSNDDDQ